MLYIMAEFLWKYKYSHTPKTTQLVAAPYGIKLGPTRRHQNVKIVGKSRLSNPKPTPSPYRLNPIGKELWVPYSLKFSAAH